MIVDVYLIVFNCVFSRAVTLNRCFNDDIMSSHHRTYYYFFEKKAPGRPGGFTEDAALNKNNQTSKISHVTAVKTENAKNLKIEFRKMLVFPQFCLLLFSFKKNSVDDVAETGAGYFSAENDWLPLAAASVVFASEPLYHSNNCKRARIGIA